MAELKFAELMTERLLLRKFDLDDIEGVTALAGAYEIADTTLRIPHPYTEMHAKEWIEQQYMWLNQNLSVTWAITIKASGELIGAIGLMNFNEPFAHAEMGYWIGKPFWGKGYATEAGQAIIKYGFDILGLNRIHAHHFSRNTSSGKVLLKIGMQHEGTFRQHIKKWDKFEDIELYGILKKDVLK
jgi:[ribosomal protein S5]-alanine N-acetyltransferase